MISRRKIKCTEVPYYLCPWLMMGESREDFKQEDFNAIVAEEGKQFTDDWDNPLMFHYARCDNPGLPENENVLFWVRLKGDKYDCYRFLYGQWFKQKDQETGYTIFPPCNPKQRIKDVIMETPHKILKKPFADLQYYLYARESCERVYRDSTRFTMRNMLKD